MKLTQRERQAVNRIRIMVENGFSLDKIKTKLEPRYSSSERRNAIEYYLFKK